MQNETITTITATIASGVLGLALSHKTALPSILFFLLFGILLGPELAGLVNPAVFNDNLPHYISLLIALILFEGGTSLKRTQYRDISRLLRRLLTVGSAVTLGGVALLAHTYTDLNWRQSLLLGSVLIVTGPTVVIPILQRLRIRENVHNILKWEAILIDPIGVVTAVVLFEFLILGNNTLIFGLWGFLNRFALGTALGLCGGWLLEQLLNRRKLFRFEGEELGSLIVVAGIFLFYGLAESMSSHAGLVTTTVIGIYLGNRTFAYKDSILRFEKKLTLFALAVLFVLLSSQIPLSLLRETAGPGFLLLAALIFIVRPAAVFASAGFKSDFTLREKMFIAAFAPRGIVSASLASLFALHLADLAGEGNQFLALAFFLIVGSILFYLLTCALIAHGLGLREKAPVGIMMVGVTPLGLAMALELQRRGRMVQFIDTNPARCDAARSAHLDAVEGSGFDLDFIESLDLKGVGLMIAMTPSHEVNLLACQAFTQLMGPGHALRLWDSTDTWENVTSPGYDQAMGRPILVTYSNPDGAEHKIDTESVVELLSETLVEPLRVTPETLSARGLPHLIFGWVKQPLFATPDAVFPAGTEIIRAKPIPKSSRSAAKNWARRALESMQTRIRPK